MELFSEVLSGNLLEELMALALAEARRAAEELEVPVGAVIWTDTASSSSPASSPASFLGGALDAQGVSRGLILGRGHNKVEQLQRATAHAEMLAIQEASATLENWRLTNSLLVCTLEPCVMCLGALRLARIPAVVFGAGDSRFGAMGSVYNLVLDDRTGPAPKFLAGVRKNECSDLLKSFFAARRVAA
jgi:tRNA(adenine34) deaminase